MPDRPALSKPCLVHWLSIWKARSRRRSPRSSGRGERALVDILLRADHHAKLDSQSSLVNFRLDDVVVRPLMQVVAS